MVEKKLTTAEEQVMQHLWDLEHGFLKDIVEKYDTPRPAYTTVSTVVRVLVRKGFIGFRAYGKTNEYFPKVTKAQYFQQQVTPMLSNYLKDSPSAFASYFASSKLGLAELEDIKKLIDDRIRKIKAKKSK
ncbi:MAG TPA: BlaI/MecI/CopY family transcriptional regulator [Chryseolinea sp.]|nr:BlaI/MecI/CopY family transcriptional regulator [Chryseolinea sp.]